MAENAQIGERVDVLDIEQWLVTGILEQQGDTGAGRAQAIQDLLERYNRIVERVETDPSLRIELAVSGHG